MRTKKPRRSRKKLPPELLKIAAVLHFELRNYLKPDAPPWLILQATIAVIRAQQVIASDKGIADVMKRHGAPGGSHDLASATREAWASGAYKSREQCAEQVHSKIGNSRKTARNSLINTPKPKR